MATTEKFRAINPATEEYINEWYDVATPEDIERVVLRAEAAYRIYRQKSNEDIANFLEQSAAEIESLGDVLIQRCHEETALPIGRLQGERGRTCGQLRLFARVVREGSWKDARIDRAMPDRLPFPKADIRHLMRPLGPVAIFGASNFPLAFSTAGGDTASALAAGCPVIVKGHPAHPGTAALVAQAVISAADSTGMPSGTFALIQGDTHEIGQILVKHPAIKAVGFTGSYRGGKAIYDAVQERAEIIPVFAEMGSANPVFILPGALTERADDMAKGLADSINLGVGQFCTNPGLSFFPKGEKGEAFKKSLATAIYESGPQTMLTAGIKEAYDTGTSLLSEEKRLTLIAKGQSANGPNQAISQVYEASIEAVLADEEISEEVFGPSSILVSYESKEQVLQVARDLKGHLTATVHAAAGELSEYQELFDILEQKVGRIVINGYPTGVEVCDAMVHGGPYPATTAPHTTSVGTNAIKRFARPICYQGYPDEMLPAELQNANPLNVWRLIDGQMSRAPIRYNNK